MYIYLKKSEELEKAIVRLTNNSTKEHLFNQTVWDYQTNPCLSDVIDDFEILNQNPVLKPFFLKATILSKPKYQCLSAEGTGRQFGIYVFGKAKAELTPIEGDKTHWKNYSLKIETSSWEGIADMETLKERLWAGTIAPTVSYDRKQQKQNIFHVLAEILSLHKLSLVKRFFLALRLTKVS